MPSAHDDGTHHRPGGQQAQRDSRPGRGRPGLPHPAGDTIASVLEHVRGSGARRRGEVLGGSKEPTPVSSTQAASYRLLERTLRSVFPGAVVAPALYAAGSDSQHFVPIADSIYRFSPVRVKPEDLARLHGTDERISVANLGELVRFYHQLLRNLNAPAPVQLLSLRPAMSRRHRLPPAPLPRAGRAAQHDAGAPGGHAVKAAVQRAGRFAGRRSNT